MERKSLWQHYVDVLTKDYANFNGRARRREYWGFTLFNTLVSYAISLGLAAIDPSLASISMIYSLAVLIPTLAVAIRRMHDVGKSGWFLLIPIYNLILAATEGDRGSNEYGIDPKGGVELDDFGKEESLEN